MSDRDTSTSAALGVRLREIDTIREWLGFGRENEVQDRGVSDASEARLRAQWEPAFSALDSLAAELERVTEQRDEWVVNERDYWQGALAAAVAESARLREALPDAINACDLAYAWLAYYCEEGDQPERAVFEVAIALASARAALGEALAGGAAAPPQTQTGSDRSAVASNGEET